MKEDNKCKSRYESTKKVKSNQNLRQLENFLNLKLWSYILHFNYCYWAKQEN